MVKEIGANLKDYMDNTPIEFSNPFYINEYKNGKWTDGDNHFELEEAKWWPNNNDDDMDYFVIAVKQGFEVDIAIESSSIVRWTGMTGESGYEWERIGGNSFLRFTMTGGGFLEISGGFGATYSDLWSQLEQQLGSATPEQLANFQFENEGIVNKISDFLGTDHKYSFGNEERGISAGTQRVRFSTGSDINIEDDKVILHGFPAIQMGVLGGEYMTVILDAVRIIPESDLGGVPETQKEMVPADEEVTTKDDIGTWELIHERFGQEWFIVEMNNPTDSKTWGFYFNGMLISAFAEKNDALISLNFHYDNFVRVELSKKPAEIHKDGLGALIYGFVMIVGTRILGGFL